AVRAMPAGSRVLPVAQARFGRRGGPGARQPCARVGIVRAERLQPALRFLLEIVESAHRPLPSVPPSRLGASAGQVPNVRLGQAGKKELPACRGLPRRSRGSGFLLRSRRRRGGSRAPLPRTGGAPVRAAGSVTQASPRGSRLRLILHIMYNI